VDPDLPENTIALRPSLIKFEGKYEDLEILDSNKYRSGYLNRQIIILLLSLGVPESVFLELQNDYLDQIESCSLKYSNIYQFFNIDFEDEFFKMNSVVETIRKLTDFDI